MGQLGRTWNKLKESRSSIIIKKEAEENIIDKKEKERQCSGACNNKLISQ